LLESLLTASIVDDMTDTESDKNQEAKGQGIANIVAGFFGGMAGCAMIGQSVINVKSGGRGRLSAFIAGTVLMFLILVLGDFVVQMPMPALVGVMIMVSIGTFDWSSISISSLKKVPLTDTLVMIVTVAVVVKTHNLAIGVISGILLSAIFFVAKISKVEVVKQSSKAADKVIYQVSGQIFFASVTEFVEKFDYKENIRHAVIDFSGSHVWDDSAVGAIDKVVIKFRENGIDVSVVGLNESSSNLVDRLATYNKADAKAAGH